MTKNQSLAASSGAITTQFQLPTIFQGPQPKIEGRFISPYICFAHPKRSVEWARIGTTYTVDEGDMFLMEKDSVTPLDPAKLGLLAAKQFWCEVNGVGDILRASFQEMPSPFKEHIEAVVLVYLQDRLVVANVEFRTTKCPAGKALADALTACVEPEWAERGQAYKETFVCSSPWMRFYGNIVLSPQITAKGSGLPYRTTQCSIEPTGIPEWRLIKVFCDDLEGSQKALTDAAARFEQRLNIVTSKCAK